MKTNNNNNNVEAEQIGAVEELVDCAVAPLGSFPNSSGVAPTPAISTPMSDDTSATTSSGRRSTVTEDGSSLLLDSDEVDGVYVNFFVFQSCMLRLQCFVVY